MDPVPRKAVHEAMVRLSDGDRSAFPVLMNELWPVILAFARRGVGHQQDAEDVAQEVFLRICSRIADFDRGRDGFAWALGIASFEILTWRRRKQRRRENLDSAGVQRQADEAMPVEDRMIQQEVERALTQAIGHLSEQERVSLGLAVDLDQNVVTGTTLRKRRQRALDRLRTVWRRLHGEP